MRRSLLNKRILPKPLRQALVLITLLLLPSAAWGEEYTYSSFSSWDSSLSDYLYWDFQNNSNQVFRSPEYYSYISKIEIEAGAITQVNSTFEVTINGETKTITATTNATGGTINDANMATYTYIYTPDATSRQIEISASYDANSGTQGWVFINNVTVYYSTPYGLTIGETALTSDNVASDGTITGLTDITGTIKFTPADENTPATLTLENATIKKESVQEGMTLILPTEISSNLGNEQLTINLVGTNKLFGFISDKSSAGTLKFTGDGSLEISNGNGTISGYTAVDFGDFNLASISAPGIYWDEEYNRLSGFEGPASDVTITTETYYPIWINDPSLGQEATHTQLKNDKLSVAMGDGTVSFDGNHTITINAITFNYNSNTLIVVGPGMEQLTVDLVGESTGDDATILNLWDTTPLTFTTEDSNSKLTTAASIISWEGDGNGQVTYQNGLVFNLESSPYRQTISTTGVRIKIGDISINATGDITGNGIEGTVRFETSTNTNTNTLTLTDATIGGATAGKDIQVFVDDLKVVISGNNTVYGDITYVGNNNQSSSIQINKAEGATASLTLENINSFGACTWGEGLYLTALIEGQVTTNAIAPHYEYIEGEGSFSDYKGATVSKVIFSTTVSYPLWVAGTQVTPENKANILSDARTSISYDDESNTLTLKSAISNPEADFVVLGSGVSTLNVHVTGYNNVGRSYYTVFTSVDDCTVTLIKDETFSGTLDCSNADAIYSDAVTVMYNGEAITNEGDDGYGRILQDDIDGADISLFGGRQVYDVGTMIEGYNYYESDRPWAFTKATTVTSDGYIPVLCTEATTPYTVSMRPNNESGIGSATKLSLLFDWNGNEPTKDVTAIIESIDGSTNYSSSVTLPKSGGTIEIPITDGGNVLVNGFNVKFSSDDEAFSFALLAARLDYTLNNYLNILGQNIDISQDATINNDNCSFISKGSVVFTVSTKTVTFTDASIVYTDYTVETGIEDLKVNLVGENSVNTGDGESGAFHAITESASIDLEGEGSMTITTLAESPFTDFGEDKITYNKLVCWKSGDENWTIAPPSAPEIKGVMYEGSLAVEISKKYKDGDIYYKIDYAGETEDISERTKYEDSFIMAAPGIVTAWVEVNDAITDEVIGKYFGYIDTPYTIAKGSTKETTIYPLIAEEDGFGISYSSQNESIATFANGTITGVAAGTTQVRSSLTTTNSSLEYTILNQKTTGVDVSDSYIITLDVTVQELIDESTFTSGQNYGTFYNTSTETYKVPEGLVAYVVTGVTEGSITIAETTILPPNAPVLLYRTNLENATNYTFTQATASDGTFPEGNILEYAYEAVSTDASSKLYVLYNGMFVKVTSGTDIAAKHCYLDLGNTVANTRGFYTIGGGEGTTAIQKVNCEKLADGEWYTLQGQRVAKPAKGLYILNGKKVVVK